LLLLVLKRFMSLLLLLLLLKRFIEFTWYKIFT
jgi:hypothetical protein